MRLFARRPSSPFFCSRGRIYDVALDIRHRSPTFGQWFGCELVGGNARGMFIPAGVAHGFLTIEPETDVLYQIDRLYQPEFSAGVRWNDPVFSIHWPGVPAVVSERDSPRFCCVNEGTFAPVRGGVATLVGP